MQSLNFEVKRKIFHLYSIIIPLCYFFIQKPFMILSLSFITVIIIYIDISRKYNDRIKDLINKIFDKILRKEEKNNELQLTGTSFMFLGFLITTFIFPKELVITSWLVLIIADCAAALVGMNFKGVLLELHYNTKSIEGSIAFFSSSIFISVISYFILEYNTTIFVIILSSLLTTIVEFYSKEIKINDNLLIPVTYCISAVTVNAIL